MASARVAWAARILTSASAPIRPTSRCRITPSTGSLMTNSTVRDARSARRSAALPTGRHRPDQGLDNAGQLLFDEGGDQVVSIGEVVVEGGTPDAGGEGDLPEREVGGARPHESGFWPRRAGRSW